MTGDAASWRVSRLYAALFGRTTPSIAAQRGRQSLAWLTGPDLVCAGISVEVFFIHEGDMLGARVGVLLLHRHACKQLKCIIASTEDLAFEHEVYTSTCYSKPHLPVMWSVGLLWHQNLNSRPHWTSASHTALPIPSLLLRAAFCCLCWCAYAPFPSLSLPTRNASLRCNVYRPVSLSRTGGRRVLDRHATCMLGTIFPPQCMTWRSFHTCSRAYACDVTWRASATSSDPLGR